MPMRTFAITLPNDTIYHQLYPLITAVTGAIPTDGILPDRGTYFLLQADLSNNADTITIGDKNNTNTNGPVLNAGDPFTQNASGNTIDFKSFYVKQSTGGLKCEVALGFK
jgi:hypothetical protein